ncbi:RDD domain-containing protein [Haloferula helveola]|uniref:RDD domain-containing protein n=1 Tax=Haloferula helveola TaxID=490095 RepID=A0ABN6H5W1_9BACT|nr:RDD domain-containing protein [Haloferula helveola]
MNYWVAIGEETQGPFPVEEIGSMLQSGQLTADTMVMPEDGEEWVPLSAVFDIAPSRAPLPPPAPPAPPRGAVTGMVTPGGATQPGTMPKPGIKVAQPSSSGPIIAILAVVVVLGGGAGIFVYQANNKAKERRATAAADAAAKAEEAAMAEESAQKQKLAKLTQAKAVVTQDPLTVNFSTTPTTDADLKLLEGLTDLKVLHVGGGEISDEGMRTVAGLTGLMELTIGARIEPGAAKPEGEAGEAPTPDAGAKAAEGAGSMTISDAGLSQLSKLENLVSLELWGVGMTDQSFPMLGELPKLRRLTLMDTAITEETAQQFKKDHHSISLYAKSDTYRITP